MVRNNKLNMAKKKYTKLEIGALAHAFDKTFVTIQRWIDEDNIILTTPKAQEVLNSLTKTKIN